MTSMELERYTSVTDKDLEELTKLEVDGREDSFMRATVFWQRLGNVCTLFLLNKKEGKSVEYEIPNDEVAHWLEHPFAHRNAILTPLKKEGFNDASN